MSLSTLAAPRSRWTNLLRTRELSTLFILLAEIAFFGWYLWPDGGGRHPFVNAENGLLILKYSAIYGIAAIGASMVIISGGVDLAPGAVIALTTVVLGHQYLESQWSLPASILAGLGVGVLAGALSAALVVLVRLPPFIATLGVMGITRGLAYIVTEGRFFDVSARIPPDWAPLGVPLDWIAPIVMVVLMVVFHLFMRHVQAGRAVFAVGGNETAARYYFDDVDPVGKPVQLMGNNAIVVGVARDSKYRTMRESMPQTIYTTFEQDTTGAPSLERTLYIRTAGDPAALAPTKTRALSP